LLVTLALLLHMEFPAFLRRCVQHVTSLFRPTGTTAIFLEPRRLPSLGSGPRSSSRSPSVLPFRKKKIDPPLDPLFDQASCLSPKAPTALDASLVSFGWLSSASPFQFAFGPHPHPPLFKVRSKFLALSGTNVVFFLTEPFCFFLFGLG